MYIPPRYSITIKIESSSMNLKRRSFATFPMTASAIIMTPSIPVTINAGLTAPRSRP